MDENPALKPEYGKLYSGAELKEMGLEMLRFHHSFSLYGVNGTRYVFKHYAPSEEKPDARFGLESIIDRKPENVVKDKYKKNDLADRA